MTGDAWHARTSEDVCMAFDVSVDAGLSDHDVERRRREHGVNELPRQRKQSAFARFLQQFRNPLVYILLISGLVTIILGGITDASVILGVVLVNALIGFIQEGKAVEALEALAGSVGTDARVIRSGRKQQVAVVDLVPGDVVVLESGDRVPADMRLVNARDLAIAEAALTGESVPVEKRTGPLDAATVLADRINMAYASTVVTYGSAVGIVTSTGANTEVGAISTLLADTVILATPLTKAIERFSNYLLVGIIILAALTFGAGLLRGEPFLEMVLAAVALAVGAIPEGLPAAVTIILAIGVARMAKRRAIIRRLAAVETLGSTTVICSDKTGTLTQNQMTVVTIMTDAVVYDVTGTGYAPDGRVVRNGEAVDVAADAALDDCLHVALLCGTAVVENREGRWDAIGDPTEAALVVLAMKAGMQRDAEERDHPLVDTIPFSSEDQFMATLHRQGETMRIHLKGSVEAVLSRSVERRTGDGRSHAFDHDAVLAQAADISAQGLRVLALAVKDVDASHGALEREDVANGMIFCGLVAMVDPPREEVKEAIRECQRAGITVKMITGDHAATASTIAMQLGLSGAEKDGRLVARTGAELSAMDGESFARSANDVAVFARATPEQKLRIVEALQGKGHVVSMTGDGVNDAPALRAANIGVAMGRTGTDVAKDAADMVLTDDNFTTIVAAVEEGRTVFDNLLKFIVWTIPTNIGEGLVIVAAIALGMELPILPVQILWINMTTAIILGLPLAFEPRQPDVMDRPPRDASKPILSKDLLLRTIFVGTLLLCFSFSLFLWELDRGESIDTARTAAANGFVIMEIFYLFACRTLVLPVRTVGFFSNGWVWGGVALTIILQLAFTYLPFMNMAFKTVPLALDVWVGAVASGIVVLLLVTIEKALRRRIRG
ncbi:MAG: HAD-IC family P-type ATPase ['Candidatus Kapabacteria' thiocyanatum]|uniref:Carbonate dehydratase n=1 Tax=Candidatus Kapaibacterium thiocyanatum TaxID=1895771 RepID=A0A1M3KVY8_9BACT|nr:HAD-IC family P-type ATPase ['Candidatus Kapabacteria' thiocyanatum]OJX56621.1 MAG: carbonate dehydratase ['Candidatus Kapabacteria' thiocyanatum]